MTIDLMRAIYDVAKSIYNGERRLVDAKKYINEKFGVNANSFADYYRAFQKMLDGGIHSRIISSSLRDFFLSRISEDYGQERLTIALKAYMESILYYERTHNNSRLKTDRSIYEKYNRHLHSLQENEKPDIDSKSDSFYEGELGQILITKYERSTEARQKCIETKGVKCIVCGFDFESVYGDLGKGFIHVHHIQPIATRNGSYEINYERDLVPVCPNCHAMLHRRGGSTPLSIDELKQIIDLRKNDKR